MSDYSQLYPVIAAILERESLEFPNRLARLHADVLLRVEQDWGLLALEFIEALLFGQIQKEPQLDFAELEELQMLRHLLRHNCQVLPESPKPAEVVAGQSHWPSIRSRHELVSAAARSARGEHLYPLQGRLLGEILREYGALSREALDYIDGHHEPAATRHISLGQMLRAKELISEETLTRALCVQAGVLIADVIEIYIPTDVLALVPVGVAMGHQLLPLCKCSNTLYLAVSDPFSMADRQLLGFLAGMNVVQVFASARDIAKMLRALYGDKKTLREADAEFRNLARMALDAMPAPIRPPARHEVESVSENDFTIINLVDQMLRDAIAVNASDIHIELFQAETETEIRFRRDGRMERFSGFPASYHHAVVSRIKIMAELDIAEHRHPQDGKISFPVQGGVTMDLRVAIIPTTHGVEFVTIRILPSGEPLPLVELGMGEHELAKFREMFHHPYGLILVCGPTGSGKTTTLHSVLRELNTADRKIWTAEDPVEIVQPHLCQVQVNSKIGLTFEHLLRSFLRADPDIIMIGEMRDQETARIALEASMTGHLVLSTLHTNSAPETVARLLDLGIDPYNLSDALLAILAQRLVRKFCTGCVEFTPASDAQLDQLAGEYYFSSHVALPSELRKLELIADWRARYGRDGIILLGHPVGCEACLGGYRGRLGLFELMVATPSVKQLVRAHAGAAEYLDVAKSEGMVTLKQDGIHKVLAGVTDMQQVHAACN